MEDREQRRGVRGAWAWALGPCLSVMTEERLQATETRALSLPAPAARELRIGSDPPQGSATPSCWSSQGCPMTGVHTSEAVNHICDWVSSILIRFLVHFET